jgi:hypothetical protein
LRTADGKEIGRVDLPVRYLIGSGHFCRSYLVDIDGLLHESPITWYTSKKTWDMSPGYELPTQPGFERPVKTGCIACHVGRVELPEVNDSRMVIREQPIGCESCHGPGSLHVGVRKAQRRPAGDDDLTIVNPGKLPRPLQESICAVCHQGGPARITLRGRHDGDFRPGRPLADYRADFRFDAGSEQMTVVGHVEQLRRSACYQKSADLTCVTCHDPHAAEKPKDPIAFYRQKCLDCHSHRGCKLPEPERRKKDAADSCMACHMPHGKTDIPHVAFTHHRIGKHPAPAAPASARPPDLVPTDDLSQLRPLDQQRNLGLAYLAAAGEATSPAHAREYRARARDLLEAVHAAGLSDGPTSDALARIYHEERDFIRARAAAEEAVAADDVPIMERAVSYMVLADCCMRDREFESAVRVLEKMARVRRYSEVGRRLAVCYLELNEPQRAAAALEQAIVLQPFRPDLHGILAEAYDRIGDRQRAHEHRDKADVLARPTRP